MEKTASGTSSNTASSCSSGRVQIEWLSGENSRIRSRAKSDQCQG